MLCLIIIGDNIYIRLNTYKNIEIPKKNESIYTLEIFLNDSEVLTGTLTYFECRQNKWPAVFSFYAESTYTFKVLPITP